MDGWMSLLWPIRYTHLGRYVRLELNMGSPKGCGTVENSAALVLWPLQVIQLSHASALTAPPPVRYEAPVDPIGSFRADWLQAASDRLDVHRHGILQGKIHAWVSDSAYLPQRHGI